MCACAHGVPALAMLPRHSACSCGRVTRPCGAALLARGGRHAAHATCTCTCSCVPMFMCAVLCSLSALPSQACYSRQRPRPYLLLTTYYLLLAGLLLAAEAETLLTTYYLLLTTCRPATRGRGRDLARGARAGWRHLVLRPHGGSQCGLGQRPAHFEDRRRPHLIGGSMLQRTIRGGFRRAGEK